MRWVRSLSFGVAVAVLAFFVFTIEAGRPAPAPSSETGRIPVDVQLVLAVDVSLSMDGDEQRLQRDAYVAAFRDSLIHSAIRGGALGRIAVTYIEWSGEGEQTIVVPWMLIDSPGAAASFAQVLARMPISHMRRTSLSSAMRFAAGLFDTSPFVAERRVIDFSGDGSNNDGPPLPGVRDEVVRSGVVINGLPLVFDRIGTQTFGEVPITLEMYYEQCVIGGAGAFLIPVRDMGEFRDALKTKLILEIAAIRPQPEDRNVIRASETTPAPEIACDGRYSF